MRIVRLLAVAFALLPLAACHSPYMEATVSNHTDTPILLLEVDYPSASFGTQSLQAGEDFHYRFKVLGSGNVRLTYTDSLHQDKTSDGPYLKEGSEGQVHITIAKDGVHWDPAPSAAPKS